MSAFASTSSNTNPRSEFESQRSELVREIALGMESVLQYINRLNRNLESIIAVGNEFSSVEALWSQFENVMGSEENQQQQQQQQQEQKNRGEGEVEGAEDEDDDVEVKREEDDGVEEGYRRNDDIDDGHRR
ncbi:Dolichyl-diphosphooligosaccharide-protein glycosyltransferase subunit dad1 [Talaromyces marneffei ATCC 18224]|uniref:DASH complex subunit DAD1 n=2 Tax=Talaromyces marneffei TaxID=37727 RepID=B6Q1N8_TALMQ|nr:uncharacterized protein EYB26_002157 [Talaromyces marneffei]EEA28891.1 conserved hypothetical protein [Talaromyces marneffei ATCC 18224]QGA14502.1 hypothetical protein EYB26_002157 [Talaromyces marneffei]